MKKLGFDPKEDKDAFHKALGELRDDHGLGHDFHGNIGENGEYIDPKTHTEIIDCFNYF